MSMPSGLASRRWLAGTLMVGALGGALLLACADQERRRILTLLFDGVPPEETGSKAPATSTGPGPQDAAPDAGQPPVQTARFLDPNSTKARTVSSNHASFATNCDRCHGTGAQVVDDACLACHTERAHQPSTEMPFSCGSCHVEHSGPTADLTRPGSDRCTECHDEDPFEEEHPEFALLDDADAARVAKYATGLEVFHSVHRDLPLPDGEREGEALACMDCHRMAPAQPERFEPPTYQASCARCHELELHKSTPQVDWAELRDQLAAGADSSVALLSDARFAAWQGTDPDAAVASSVEKVREALIDDGLEACFRCHSLADRDIDGDRYAVVPVTRYRSRWFPRMRFKHSAHTFLDCAACHVAPGEQAQELGTLMLPGVDNCTTCHRAEGASSACSTCHTFHTRTARYDHDPARSQRAKQLLNLGNGTKHP
ncbi:MAG: hypothetical protein GY778_16160 [bacterium]|nr:hypothetical protein [bacterium]